MRVDSLAVIVDTGGRAHRSSMLDLNWLVATLRRTETLCAMFCGKGAALATQWIVDQIPDLIPYAAGDPTEGDAYDQIERVIVDLKKKQLEAHRILFLCHTSQALEIELLLQHFLGDEELPGHPLIRIEAEGTKWECANARDRLWATLSTYAHIQQVERKKEKP